MFTVILLVVVLSFSLFRSVWKFVQDIRENNSRKRLKTRLYEVLSSVDSIALREELQVAMGDNINEEKASD
ncbi:MAG: hypothetical protein IKB98_04035 [Clostridia bacterium]|nr:hypothetical protein [Clostridia bacterium]